ncbi:MAG: glutamate formimidoyltransferase [Acidobacteria bacterium]|nr:MAG: glutamate formimidoyltransferase [Acidobacteriota bacterium]
MKQQLIECVPNFSEGNDMSVIQQITSEIEGVEGVKLLDVDPGKATNRTVVTFVGTPQEVIAAAVRAARKAAELIDMRQHHGEHPRFGAIDVCPLIPVANITMEETVLHAHELARRLGDEVGLTIYCYEHAARTQGRRNLALVREGEYEGLEDRLGSPDWKPDFGPATFSPSSGATAVGARDFLVAYNVNLNTTSTRRANAIAFDVREKGRKKREGNPLTGPVVKDDKGEDVWNPGSLKSVKAIGWFIKEYGIAQISMNLTHLGVTPVHVAFDEVCEKARQRGIRVTGSELVGLIPLQAMLDAGRFFLRKQQRSTGVSDAELIKIAVKSLGLSDLYPFKPDEKIIEYAMADRSEERLIDMTLADFTHETASESAAPGGGSISAAVGALGAALATMVANLSAHKKGWDDRWEEFSSWAEKGKRFHDELLALVDEDTQAFNKVMDVFAMPRDTEAQKAEKKHAMEEATKYAMDVPFRVMQSTYDSMEVIKAMADNGNPSSASDAGVGALCARTAVLGAYLNIKTNAAGLEDKKFADDMLAKGEEIETKAISLEREILAIVNRQIAN